PNKPKRSDQQVPAGETSLRLIQYTSELDADTGFSVGWFQLPQAPAESAVRGFLEATENGSVAAIKGKLLDSSFTTIDGHPAVEYLSTGPGGHFVRSRTILIGKDVYVLQVVSKTRQAPKYKEFIDSFKVV
ncbi:MAG TPA: hypothetical protein VGO92_00650, partial [Acidimicrobiales bacterium]|nr:hypothetical protein [Acidimicrobiales bacterium]